MSCLPCGYEAPDDAPTFPDISGYLCSACAPRVSALIEPNDGSLVDMETGEPLTAEAMRAWHDRAIAGGAEPGDSLARWL